APGSVDPDGGNLVAIRSEGTRPAPPRPDASADDPDDLTSAVLTDCLLMTGGVALSAELGKGVVALNNCGVAAGSAAFLLRPEKVARSAFAADLRLERCTVLAERDFVRLGPWPGADPGPDRPWLITSHACAFLDEYDHAGG